MSATYLVEVVTFDDLRPGDRVLHQGAPVMIGTIGKVPVVGVTAAYYQDAAGIVGTFMPGLEPALYRIIPDTPPALEAA